MCIKNPLATDNTPGNPFAYPGINITRPSAIYVENKMFILIDLTNIYVLESISSRI